jgi:hypothetical protein
MESRSLDGYIDLGGVLRFLIHSKAGDGLAGEGEVLQNLEILLKSCEDLGLHVSMRMTERQFSTYLEAQKNEQNLAKISNAVTGSKSTKKRVLSTADAEMISRGATMIEEAALAESMGMFVYVAREQRFAADRLLNDIGFLMAPGIYDLLPEMAQFDFSEAGRCIAYEVPTAAAFHLMRGTEDVLRWFYKEIAKSGATAKLWGPIVQNLRTHRDAPPKVLLDNLDNIRHNFRNPTQHPEKVYDIQEAQDLLSLSIDVVNRMVRHLHPTV